MLKKKNVLCYLLAAVGVTAAAEVGTAADIAGRLAACTDYNANAKFEVWLPNASDPVVYDVVLHSRDNSGRDSLLSFDYLIEWTLPRGGGESSGFNSYFGGNHYRYRDGRLQEYHYSRNADAFAPGGNLFRGVHRQAQFVDLLPGALLSELNDMQSDSCYQVTVTQHAGKTELSGKQFIAGSEVRDFKYVFDSDSGLPLQLDIDTNPGQISEQSMSVYYTYDAPAIDVPDTEDALIAMYPHEFEMYRQSDFRLENLPGRELPEFSVQNIDGSRFTHHKREMFDSPLLLLFLDSSMGNPQEVLSAVRNALQSYPGSVGLLTAFVDNKIEDVEALAGNRLPDEKVLYGAKSLARDCGVTDMPVLIFADASGRVLKFLKGMNKKLSDEVLEMCISMK